MHSSGHQLAMFVLNLELDHSHVTLTLTHLQVTYSILGCDHEKLDQGHDSKHKHFGHWKYPDDFFRH